MTVSIEKSAIALGTALTTRHLTLCTAESCTGGGLSYWITSVPGSSAWFTAGYVTYSDQAKATMLAIDPTLITTFGAVSEPIARAMAENALRLSQTDISLATTGIAGPSGGSPSKPIGTVWTAIAQRNQPTLTYLNVYSGDRQAIRMQTMEQVLTQLLKIL